MFCLKDGRFCKMPLGAICVFLFHHFIFFFHLAQFCGGVSQVVGPSDPVVAIVGDDTVLPCHLDPAVNAADMTVEWTRSDLTPKFVHVWRDGVELVNKKNEAYMERTSLPINNLKLGDISLKLSKVKLSDRGSYKCFSPALSGQASVELVVGVVSSLTITVMRNSEDSGKVVLQCESAGWYPEPELLWLDGEGNLLSAGPTETLRGPDDLYTVSSRVTVEKRHSNNITCRVQQRNTNQSRETHIHVPEDFFEILSSSSSVTIGLAVSLALCIILLILSAVALLLRKRKHMMNTNRRTRDHPGGGDAEDPLMTTETEKQNTSSSSTKTKKQTSYTIKPERNKFIQKLMETFLTKLSESISQHTEKNTKINNQLKEVKVAAEKLKNQLENKCLETINSETDEFIQKLMETFLTLDSKLSESISQQTELKNKLQDEKNRNTEQEAKLQETINSETDEFIKKLKIFPALDSKLEKKREITKKLKEVKVAAEKLKNQLESKNQQPDTSKPHPEKSQTSFEEQNKSGSANHSSKTGDITVVEVERNGDYIFLKNTSSENKLLSGWKLKLQINNRESATYEFKENFILKAGETLLLQQDAVKKPNDTDADLLWMNMVNWNIEDDVKIDLISNTGEEQMLFKNKII